jgi:hypothetical protein
MKRVVVILKDEASPLHYLRCQAPCGAAADGQWCQREWGTRKPMCWLGGYGSPESARQVAESLGYEVGDRSRP